MLQLVRQPMNASRPTRVGFWRAARFCCLALFAPKRFKQEEMTYNSAPPQEEEIPSHERIRLAFWSSAKLVFKAAAVGVGFGCVSA